MNRPQRPPTSTGRWSFWCGIVACVALSVSAVEVARTSGSTLVVMSCVLAVAVLATSLYRRRADAGIRFRSTPDA